MKLKDNNSIKYVDVIADSCEVYVRCDTAEAAQTFAQQSYEGGHLTILEGKNIFRSYLTYYEQYICYQLYVLIFQAMKRNCIGTR